MTGCSRPGRSIHAATYGPALWTHEHDAGEETGRKDRPVCLLLRPPAFPGVLILFPITSGVPIAGRAFDAIPLGECRKAGLDTPAWIMLDEHKVALEAAPYDFASTDAQGEFSSRYLRKLADLAAGLIAAKKLGKVVRR